jgi:hypothetical protein
VLLVEGAICDVLDSLVLILLLVEFVLVLLLGLVVDMVVMEVLVEKCAWNMESACGSFCKHVSEAEGRRGFVCYLYIF